MQLTKLELETILSEVKKEYETIVKAEQEETPPEHDAPPAEDTPPAQEEPPADSGGEPPPPEAPPGDEGVPPPAPVDDQLAGAPGEQMDPQQLATLYSQLDPHQLAMHWMACSHALYSSMAGAAGGMEGEMGAGAPQQPPAAPPPPAAPAGPPPPMMKSEEFESLKQKYADLEVKFKTLNELVGTPVMKSVTADTEVSTAEEPKVITKSDIMNALIAKGKTTLTESDRTKIVQYSLNPVVSDELLTFLGIK